MQEKLGLNIVLFKIKNDDFNLIPYGLNDRFFRLDITKNINSSKSVKFTEYPLANGTTVIDTVSRAPGTLNFQGEIGELFFSPNSNHSIKTSPNGGKSRIELSIELLETLRDQAIVLDVLTEGKTFKNFLIESVNFTFEKFGVSTVNFTLKEFLAFEDQFEGIEDQTQVDDTLTNSYLLRTLSLPNFTTEEEMMQVLYSTISDSVASEGFAIRFGSSDINPDVFISPVSVNNIPFVVKNLITSQGGNFNRFVYTPSIVDKKANMNVIRSGLVSGNLGIKIEIDQIEVGSFTKEETIVINSNSNSFPEISKFLETPKYKIRITLFRLSEGEDIVLSTSIKDDFMISPKFSNVDKCFNPLEPRATFDNDFIITYGNVQGRLFATSFLRKTKNFFGFTKYKAVPNLLDNNDQGYLYPTFYYTKHEQIGGSYIYRINVGFVYLHPDFAYKIKDLIIENAEIKNNLLNRKTITWW